MVLSAMHAINDRVAKSDNSKYGVVKVVNHGVSKRRNKIASVVL